MMYRFGIISSKPWEEVKVVAMAPASAAPCRAPEAPPSDCISTKVTGWPNMFLRPAAAHSSTLSLIGEDGVMGKMPAMSVKW